MKPSNSKKLLDLIAKHCDEVASPEDLVELFDLVCSDERAADEYLAFMNVHATLQLSESIGADPVASSGRSLAELGEKRGSASPYGSHWNDRLSTQGRYLLSGLMAAAILIVGSALLLLHVSKSPPTDRDTSLASTADTLPGPNLVDGGTGLPSTGTPSLGESGMVASIAQISGDVVWGRQHMPRIDHLLRIRGGERIRPLLGRVEIRFFGGARVIVEGPSDLVIAGPNSCVLHSGRLFVDRGTSTEFIVSSACADLCGSSRFGVEISKATGVLTCLAFDGTVLAKPVHQPTALLDQMRFASGDLWSLRPSEPAASISVGAEHAWLVHPFRDSMGGPAGEVSLVDVLTCGMMGDTDLAGAIDPLTGHWDRSCFVFNRTGHSTTFRKATFSDVVDGIVVPIYGDAEVQLTSAGHRTHIDVGFGGTWGPIWVRRPLTAPAEHLIRYGAKHDWNVGRTRWVNERLRTTDIGIVGMHANVGVTIDLDQLRQRYGLEDDLRFQFILANSSGALWKSDREYLSEGFGEPDVSFSVYVDGALEYDRTALHPSDGEVSGEVLVDSHALFLSLVATEGESNHYYDHLVLIDAGFSGTE